MNFRNILLMLVGAISIVFIYMLYNYINSQNSISDNEKAEQIFSQYMQENSSDIEKCTNDINSINDFKSKIDAVRYRVDSLNTQNIFSLATDSIYSGRSLMFDPLHISNTLSYPYNSSEKISDTYNMISDAYSVFLDQIKNLPLDTLKKPQPGDNAIIINAKNGFASVLATQSLLLEKSISELKDREGKFEKDKQASNDARKKMTENSKDKLLITMVIPVFAFILAIIILIPYLFRNKSELFTKLLDDRLLIQVFTIFILTITILLLGVGGKLDGQTLGTLLGGISIYVLQKTLSDVKPQPQNIPPQVPMPVNQLPLIPPPAVQEPLEPNVE